MGKLIDQATWGRARGVFATLKKKKLSDPCLSNPAILRVLVDAVR